MVTVVRLYPGKNLKKHVNKITVGEKAFLKKEIYT